MATTSTYHFFATAPKGTADLLMRELETLGALQTKVTPGGVAFNGSLQVGYSACLWSRIASRILLQLTTRSCTSFDELYTVVQTVSWADHLLRDGTLAVDFTAEDGAINTLYGAQKVKDAIVDQMRTQTGARPNVDLKNPSLRVNAHQARKQVVLSIDLSGHSLHHRGYREMSAMAPLRENLAAAILYRAEWNKAIHEVAILVDPMCGTGTFLIEAAMMALDIPPGMWRHDFGFLTWKNHDAELWEKILTQAQERRDAASNRTVSIYGFDHDLLAVNATKKNVARAGFSRHIQIEKRTLEMLRPPAEHSGRGIVVTNPPYGERMSEVDSLVPLYEELGRILKQYFLGWNAFVLTNEPRLMQAIHLRAAKRNVFYNGAIACELLKFVIHSEPAPPIIQTLSPGEQAFKNRLQKNMKHLKSWRQNKKIDCYRVYDADLPEYACAIDIYGNHAHVQEYAPPKTVDRQKARIRLSEILRATKDTLSMDKDHVVLKVRRRQKPEQQYQRFSKTGAEYDHFFVAREGGQQFWLNLHDYLDTGLFLDHRLVREYVADLSQNHTLLNLFCYTASTTVYAAAAGATRTTSVDLSRTYLDWARRNFELNRLPPRHHQLIESDGIDFLKYDTAKYDVIFMNPPTFSNSKRLKENFDVQRDHTMLFELAAKRLRPNGILIFSTHAQRFKLDYEALSDFNIHDFSKELLPYDFARRPRIFQCFKAQLKSSEPPHIGATAST